MSLICVSMQNNYVYLQDNYIDIQVTSGLSKSDSYVVKLLERVGINILDVNIINLHVNINQFHVNIYKSHVHITIWHVDICKLHAVIIILYLAAMMSNTGVRKRFYLYKNQIL